MHLLVDMEGLQDLNPVLLLFTQKMLVFLSNDISMITGTSFLKLIQKTMFEV